MMFATKQDISKNSFRSKIPKHEVYEPQQNQRSKITNYQEIIPDRKLMVKRGVFPYAIQANPVSKGEVFGKDQHISDSINKNDSHCFQKPKSTFRLFDEKVSKENPLFKNKIKPSTSTGFFATNTQKHQTTPLNSKNPRDDVTFSNFSNTTEKNKQMLLNSYLTEQCDAVFKAKTTSTDEPKHINFNAEEALQICTYKQIGEVMNQSLIEKSLKFKCSLNSASSIQARLRKLHFERKNRKRNSKETVPLPIKLSKNATDECEYTTSKRTWPNDNFPATSPNNLLLEEENEKPNTKSFIIDGNFRLKNSLLKTDKLSHWKGNNIRYQSYEGNDKAYRRYPHLHNMPERSNDRNNLATSPPPNNFCVFTRNFEMKKQNVFFDTLPECDVIYKKSPLFPTHRQNVSPGTHLKSEFKAADSPTLFFSDTDQSSITPKIDKNKQMPPKNKFSLDSAIFKRKFSPELINPIEMMNCTLAKSPEKKKKTTRRRKIINPNPSYSDSTCQYGAKPFNHLKKYKHDEFHTKANKYPKFGLNKEKYNLF